MKAGVEYLVFIPMRFLSPNPGFPLQMLTTSIALVDTSLIVTPSTTSVFTFDLITQATIIVSVRLTYTVPEMAAFQFKFISAQPSSTIQGLQLTSLTLTFILGVPVVAGGYLGFFVTQNIFASSPNDNTWPFISVGYDCGTTAGGINGGRLCCSQTRVTTRLQGTGGVNPLVSPWPGMSSMRLILGPKGCMLPANKVITIVLGSWLLGKNPSISSTWVLQEEKFETEATVTVATAVVINIAMTTSSEPYIGWVAYYGEPINPVSNGVGVTIIAPGTVRWPRVYYSVIGWGAWVVGCSVVGGFTAVPSTTVTGQTPDTVTITFSLGVVAILNASSATVNAVIISPTYGVFQPNMGSLYSPYPFLAGGRPTACVSMRWYTNAYGTMILLLNPLFDVKEFLTVPQHVVLPCALAQSSL